MAANRTAGPVQARSKTKPVNLDTAAVDHATRLIHQVCCLAGSFDLLEDFRDYAMCAAVDRRDSAALFDRLMHDFSFQGISDEIAANYMLRHGQATWHAVRKNIAKRPTCPKLKTYWHFHGCRYDKTSRTCAEPEHIATCPLPTHRLRNGHLNQLAYSLFLFIRDVADGDLVTEAEIATITGHSLRSVGAILDSHYLSRDPALAESAIRKLEKGTKAPD